ncbi:hypothetical protein WG66_016013 [Moniliophthora roreri]|nr:hypothetical protein WG66_016013 [Moniliophthora roreri]
MFHHYHPFAPALQEDYPVDPRRCSAFPPLQSSRRQRYRVVGGVLQRWLRRAPVRGRYYVQAKGRRIRGLGLLQWIGDRYSRFLGCSQWIVGQSGHR